MVSAAAIEAGHRISVPGWLLVGCRLVLMLILFLVCAPLQLLWLLLGLGRFWPRLFLTGIGAIAGMHIRTSGRARRNALLVSNHVSWMDIPAFAHTAGSAFVAHDGLAAFPVLKWLCEMNDTVFIARNDRASIAHQVAQVREAMVDGGALTIFPEGTTSDGTDMLPFKSALLSAANPVPEGVVIQPAVLEYADAPLVAWVGDEPGMDNFLYILSRLCPVHLEVHFLDPLSGSALEDRKVMSAAARDIMVRQLS